MMEYVPKVQEWLRAVVQQHADTRAQQWLQQQEEKLIQQYAPRTLYLSFSMVPRFVSKQPIHFSKEEQQVAHRLKKGFAPQGWPLAQWVRAYLLMLLPTAVKTRKQTLTQLLETADVDEQVAVYSSLHWLPNPEPLVPLAVNGLRTNITRVFDALVLRNPFPARHLNEAAWNQLLLKAVFMERPLYLIEGADGRANAELARMLTDFAHERWAAGRPVTPELWRFVAPYADASHQADLQRVVASENPHERAAGQLVCQQSEVSELRSLVADHAADLPSWQQIGEDYVRNIKPETE